MPLFDPPPPARAPELPDDARLAARRAPAPGRLGDRFRTGVDDRVLDVYRRARDPGDPFELRDLWLGRVECELGRHGHRPWLAERWRSRPVLRTVHPDEVLSGAGTARFVKELFNWFFRDDLYGDLRASADVVLSGGAVDEQAWGLPGTLKDCVRFALAQDWYGYSDSRGRLPVREAVARYENALLGREPYDAGNVALTMGGTMAVSSVADFVLSSTAATAGVALCAVPNYPPLVEAVARRRPVRLVPLASDGGETGLQPLIAALRPDTPLVLLQTVGNPTGAAVTEADLGRLVHAASPATTVVLDECHEWLGPGRRCSPARCAPNVVRVSSLSKNWSAPGLKIGWLLADPRFVAEYYEYASTTYGGPPSVLYTLVEVLARMERWRVAGDGQLSGAHLAEFEPTYGLTGRHLQAAYDSYLADRAGREDGLRVLRDAAVSGLSAVADVLRPHWSVNAAVRFAEWDDSYLCFRQLLRETGVSVLPGILTFCLSGSVVRVTSARRWPELRAAISRLQERAAVGTGG
ncbi:MAG: pyridoxal phosphate-dependent aminotransferase [Mycobacteriales bacterium]